MRDETNNKLSRILVQECSQSVVLNVWLSLVSTCVVVASLSGCGKPDETNPFEREVAAQRASQKLLESQRLSYAKAFPLTTPAESETQLSEGSMEGVPRYHRELIVSGTRVEEGPNGHLMVWLPGGIFNMGLRPDSKEKIRPQCPFSLHAINDPELRWGSCQMFLEGETPMHRVELKSFKIDLHLVTRAQFAEFLKTPAGQTWAKSVDTYAYISQRGNASAFDKQYPYSRFYDLPVTFVNWSGARSYCQTYGGDLPTEAQWEYAARAGTESLYYWGDIFDPNMANVRNPDPSPVGKYPPNPYGLRDMSGNVWQWTRDAYDKDYYLNWEKHSTMAMDNTSRVWKEPYNAPKDDYAAIVIRGGGYQGEPLRARSSSRLVMSAPKELASRIGFRCVWGAP